MTTPPPQPAQQAPPVDTGNQLLGEQPAQITTALMQTPAGQRMALTIRTPSTTLTVFLAQPDAKAWARNISTSADSMSSSGLIVANGAQVPKGQG